MNAYKADDSEKVIVILQAGDFRLPEVLSHIEAGRIVLVISRLRSATAKEAHPAYPGEPLPFRVLTPEAQAIAEVHDPVRVSRSLPACPDGDYPLSLVVREGHSPVPLTARTMPRLTRVIPVIPHLGYRLPRGRVIVAVGHDRESLYARLHRLALRDQRV